MCKQCMAVLFGLMLATVATADYIDDRAQAVRLMHAGQRDEAKAAFLAMADAAELDMQKADALSQAARLLISQGKTDDAVAEMAKVEMSRVKRSDYWHSTMLLEWARVLDHAGRRDEAIARCREMLSLKGACEELKSQAQTLLAKLQGEAPATDRNP